MSPETHTFKPHQYSTVKTNFPFGFFIYYMKKKCI
uniref:Uncharacterized protein n=1 Tax=Anguilla anguilla TaxID=7936 RepID=A0A0E9V6X8_ANGAN